MSDDNSRIAKNTVYLYIRMIFVLGANFFAVRVFQGVQMGEGF